MELLHGDISLFRPHAVGWSVFLSIFYFILGIDNVFEAMFVARWLSILLICCCFVSIVILCKKVCAKGYQDGAVVIVVTGFVLSVSIRKIATVAYTEPLFLFLTISCYCFLAQSSRLATGDIVKAALFAGLSYWVRANGLFHLFAILGMIVLWSNLKPSYVIKNGLLAIVIFISISAPQLIMRYHQFGSVPIPSIL
ncbi:MAG: hypothetical protein GY705_21475 [Bacteroidetes bacterium]|nr:hypothetical protein [Bacteroidota bacterium]